MVRRGQAGEYKTGGQRLPPPFPASVSRAASVDGFERAHGFRRRKSARSTGRRSRSTEPLPGVPAFRRLRRMSPRASGGEPTQGAARPAATIVVVSRRAAFPGEGACRRVAPAPVSAARGSTLPSRLAKPASLSTCVAFGGGAFRRRSLPPAASRPCVERVERARLGGAGFPRNDSFARLRAFPRRAAAETAGCLPRQGDADRPAAAGFLTAPARRPTLFE